MEWNTSFLNPQHAQTTTPRALIILNEPFSFSLLDTLWKACSWRACADGGSNRLYDVLGSQGDDATKSYLPNLIKGDLDSIRDDVRDFYAAKGVPVVCDPDLYATDLMKCIKALEEVEMSEGQHYDLVLLGGLTGRLDQTIHTLSYVHKLRKTRPKVYVVTDYNVGWVLDKGEHRISIDHRLIGPTCGLLPVGISSAVITTTGLKWNLTETESSFDGLMSTSNHLLPEEDIVVVKTSEPIWWCAELKLSEM